MVVPSPRKVLFVDNQPGWLEIASRVVSGLENIVTTTVTSSWDAEDELKGSGPYDLVLTDLHMHEGGHGDQVLKTVFDVYPSTRVGILSGTISESMRQRFLELEPGLVMVTKSELVEEPTRVRRKLLHFLENPQTLMRDEQSINLLAAEAVGLNEISHLHEEIDGLHADLHLLRNFLRESDLPASTREKVLELTCFDSLYGLDTGETYSRLHDYKNQFYLSERELVDFPSLRRPVALMLGRMRSMLEHSVDEGKISLSDLLNRETSRLESLYSNVTFTVVGEDNPARYLVDPTIAESLRILLSNAADAYMTQRGIVTMQVTKSKRYSEVDVIFKNHGAKLPIELIGNWASYNIPPIKSTKSYGSQFGIKRVLELGNKVEYSIGETGETITNLSLNDYSIRKLHKPETLGSQLLIIDHAGDYRHLAKADLGCSVHYVDDLCELEVLEAHAQDYFGMLLHPRNDWVLPARKIRDANPAMNVIAASGSGGPHLKMQIAFRELREKYISHRLPSENHLRELIPKMIEQFESGIKSKYLPE